MARSRILREFSFVAGEGIVERLDKRILVDEIAFPFRPGRENFFLLHVVQSFVIVKGFLHRSRSLFQHLCEGADVVEVGYCAVSGDDFHVGRQLRGGSCAARRGSGEKVGSVPVG